MSSFCFLPFADFDLPFFFVSFKIPSLGALHAQPHKIISSLWRHITIFFFSAHWNTECTSSKASSECSGVGTYNRYLATLKEYLISMLWSVVSIQFTHSHVCGWPRSRGFWISFLESLDWLEDLKTGCRSPLSWSSRLSHLSPLPCLSSNWAMLMINSAILKKKNYKRVKVLSTRNQVEYKQQSYTCTFCHAVCVKCLSPKQNENRI